MDRIGELRARLRARNRGEEADEASFAARCERLRAALAAAETHGIREALYLLDEAKAAAVDHRIDLPPAAAAVTGDEAAVLLAALELQAAAPDDVARRALAIPVEYGMLAVRLLVAALPLVTDGTLRDQVIASLLTQLEAVPHPYGRWLLTCAVADAAGDSEERALADERYRAAALLHLRRPVGGELRVDGFPVPDGPSPVVRVPPGAHWVSLSDEGLTHLRRCDLAPGQSRRLRLEAPHLPEVLVAVGGERDPGCGLPRYVRCVADDAEMVLVSAGKFVQGLELPPDDPVAASIPAHLLGSCWPTREVTIGPFYIDRRPTPIRVWRAFLRRGGYANQAYWSDVGWRRHHGGRERERAQWERWLEQEPTKPEASMCSISWHEAGAVLRWAGKRLPTEAQWERAVLALGGAALGVQHAEWCRDTFIDRYPPGTVRDPFRDGADNEPKVLRGVVLSYHGDAVTARLRHPAQPGARRPDIGFRGVVPV